jgi:hypothetical protein
MADINQHALMGWRYLGWLTAGARKQGMPELQRGERLSYCIRVLKGSVQSVSVVSVVNDRSTGLLLITNHRFPWTRRLKSALRSWKPGSLLPVHAGVYRIEVETDQSTLGTMDILRGQMMLVLSVEPVHHVWYSTYEWGK